MIKILITDQIIRFLAIENETDHSFQTQIPGVPGPGKIYWNALCPDESVGTLSRGNIIVSTVGNAKENHGIIDTFSSIEDFLKERVDLNFWHKDWNELTISEKESYRKFRRIEYLTDVRAHFQYSLDIDIFRNIY